MNGRIHAIAAASLFLAGCEGVQSAVDPKGPQAADIAVLWWVMLGICTAVFITVMAVLFLAVMRGRRQDEESNLSRRQKTIFVIAGGVAIPSVVLIGLVIYSVAVSRPMFADPADAVRVEVVGHQWWWSVSYPGQERVDLNVTTANELHIPVGRPVSIDLKSRDVIHSFWAPNLHGKTDVIPGRTTRTWIQADTPGAWRGQCAEYCGLQHAHMAFTVVAHQPGDFYRWLEAQRESAAEPQDPLAVRGREVFLNGPCVLCHTIRGTWALGSFGPDLTHVANRRSLGGGTLMNTPGHLAGWILDPQAIKPGARMPPTNLSSDDLHALLAYLDTLK